jgi:hypothetical protein
MERSSLVRGGGVFGLLAVVFLLLGLGLAFGAGYDSQAWQEADLVKILPKMHDNQDLWVVSMWAFLAGNTLIVLFALLLNQVLPGRDGVLGIAPWLIAIGVVIIHVDTVTMIAMTVGLAESFVAATGAEVAPVEALALTLVHFRNVAYLFGFMLVAIGVLVFGLRILRSAGLLVPRWTGWAAVIAGVAILVGSQWPLLGALGVLVDVGAAVVLLGFILPVSVVLLRVRDVTKEIPEIKSAP